ncbi:MAG TPA: LLM class flavin-dependent oxidoreductase [Dehalococcoidia bacterium]|nr:LLM class flavin-dependent oxidoreductase [Dehalococcoidia bacterium]
MAGPQLHFGVSIALGASETARQARWMEDLGYEYFSAGEHFMRGNPPGPTHAALPLLAVAAGATERIRLLSSVLLAPFYHPVVLAKLTATLDIASGGRLTLGVGVGGEFPVEFEAAGLNVKQRGRRTNECLEALRRLWTQEHVSYQGRHFQFTDVTLNPPPAQQPHPPIWVAGRREGAMLRAVRYGDGWLPYFYSPERYRDSVAKITQMAVTEGRDLAGFQWGHFPYISIYPTVEEAAGVAAEALGGRYLYGGDFINIVRQYCLLGPVEQCISRLQEYVDAGARHIVFSIACPREDRARHVETIAKEIIPHFRSQGG